MQIAPPYKKDARRKRAPFLSFPPTLTFSSDPGDRRVFPPNNPAYLHSILSSSNYPFDMVYLTARFALLAAAASLAAVSSVDAAVISARHSSSVASKDDGLQKDSPLLPLPARVAKAKHDSKKGGKHDDKGGKHDAKGGKHDAKGGKEKAHKPRIVVLDDDLPLIKVEVGKRAADQAFFDRKAYTRRAPHSDDKVVINGNDDHVRIHDKHRHHDDDDHDKVVVNGDNEHVHIHHRRRHHHHDWHDASKVIVNGDHDRVNVHDRRSSPRVLVHNKHGQSFIVSPTHRAIARRSSEPMERRVDESAPAGTIALMLTNDAGAQKKLGSLYMNTDKKPFELDASDTNATTTYMVADNTMDASQNRNIKYVRLHYLVNNSRNLTVDAWCATYDSTPDAPAPMTVNPCGNDTESTNPRQSQTFIYYVDTNVIAPMSAPSNSTSREEDDTEDASDIVDGGVMESATSLGEREAAPQNVTLVFEPNGPQEDTESAEDESATYTTITETHTVTVTASSTPSAMADDEEEDSASSMMTSNSVQSASASSDSSATPSSTSIDALEVKVYGASSASSSSSSEPTSMSTDSTSSTDAASTSVDAEAVASGIANPSSDSMSDPSPTVAGASSVASVASRAEMTAVDTAPYMWKFNREMRW
ncbi:hypothetical protein BDZ89DRAFT_1113875 [Hymenopellis radicata]|nr:hypothetical protein BDZ89DRAFT_1113875 [Hymenopellis radicata]